MEGIASQITSLTSVYSTVYSDADHRKHQSSASLAFVRGIHRGPVNSPHKWPVTRKMFPFDDVSHGISPSTPPTHYPRSGEAMPLAILLFRGPTYPTTCVWWSSYQGTSSTHPFHPIQCARPGEVMPAGNLLSPWPTYSTTCWRWGPY